MDTPMNRILFWFFGTIKDNADYENNIFLRVTMIIIQYYVWDCKLNKRSQSLSSCLNFYFFHMDILKSTNKKISIKMGKTNLDLCRYWHSERGRGW
jgi:hypothetical protein